MRTSTHRVQAQAPLGEDVFEVDFKEVRGVDAVELSKSCKSKRTESGEHKDATVDQGFGIAEARKVDIECVGQTDDYSSAVLDSLHTRAESDRRLAEAFTIFTREVSHIMKPRGTQNESLKTEVSTLLRELEETCEAKKGAVLVIERQEKEKKVAAEQHAASLKASKEALRNLRADLEGELKAAREAFVTEKSAAEKLHNAITLELDAERKRNGQLEVQCQALREASLDASTERDDA